MRLEIHNALQNVPGVTVCQQKVTHAQCVCLGVFNCAVLYTSSPPVLGFGCRQAAAAELRFLPNYVIGPNYGERDREREEGEMKRRYVSFPLLLSLSHRPHPYVAFCFANNQTSSSITMKYLIQTSGSD